MKCMFGRPEQRGTMMWEGKMYSAMKSSGSGTFTATSRIMHLQSKVNRCRRTNQEQLATNRDPINKSYLESPLIRLTKTLTAQSLTIMLPACQD